MLVAALQPAAVTSSSGAASAAAAAQELVGVRSALSAAVLGQDGALDAVVGALRLSRLGMHLHGKQQSGGGGGVGGVGGAGPAAGVTSSTAAAAARPALSLLLSGPRCVYVCVCVWVGGVMCIQTQQGRQEDTPCVLNMAARQAERHPMCI
jgi:hypothetical protein